MNSIGLAGLTIFIAISAMGCMASGSELTKQRAAFDLNCPQQQVQVQMLSGLAENGTGATFGARGCGKRATYVRADEVAVVLNSPIQEDK